MSSVADILEALAANAGQAQLRRGALLGGAVSDAAQVPAQYYAGQDRQKLEALHIAQVRQQMALEQSRGQREDAAAQRQTGLDVRAQTAQDASDMKENALKGIIGAGFEKDASSFDVAAAIAKAKEIGAEDLIPTVAAVHEKFAPKTEAVKPEDDIINKETGALIRKGTAKPASITNEWEAYMRDTAPGLINKPDWAAMTPQERGKALADFNTLKAVPADQRQLKAQEQQNAIQYRTQLFQEAQAGRKELTEKVEQPYQTAIGSANTLRDVVAAAKAGNKVAGSLQSLETTMAAIRAQGLNRINTAEIGVTANAGSLWDRVVGWIGKAEAGQPVPDNIQKDMTEFAGILEKAAYKKYAEGHKAVTTRYGLKDERPLAAPGLPDTTVTPSTVKVLSITPVKP